MAYLYDSVKCKIVVDVRCLQPVENFKYPGCETAMKMKSIFNNNNYQNFLKYWEFYTTNLNQIWLRNVQ
jgi:hypothetical protein